MDEELLKVVDVARRLNCSTRLVIKMVNNGVLPAFVIGDRGFRIRASAVRDYVASKENGADGGAGVRV